MARNTKQQVNYSSGVSNRRQSASTSSGGPLGRKGEFVSRKTRYRDMRRAFGLSAG